MLLVSKSCNYQNRVLSNELRDIGRGGGAECDEVTVNLFMCDRGVALKYGVSSPKFIWASCDCALLYSLAATPKPPSPFGLIYEGAISHPR